MGQPWHATQIINCVEISQAGVIAEILPRDCQFRQEGFGDPVQQLQFGTLLPLTYHLSPAEISCVLSECS